MKVIVAVIIPIVIMSVIGAAVFGMSSMTASFDGSVEHPESSELVHPAIQDNDSNRELEKEKPPSLQIPNDYLVAEQDTSTEDTWYVGEGLRQGDFFSYSLCHNDYRECTEIIMDIWIKGDTQVQGKDAWVAETVTYDRYKIVKNQMFLDKSNMRHIGNTTQIDPYEKAFQSSVLWLSDYATFRDDHNGGSNVAGPKEFAATSWGKFGNIGGVQVAPLSAESITTPAGTFEAVAVGWEGYFWSKMWVVDEFPFPVKGKIYTHVTDGIPPPEFDFTLLEYKENVQQNPFEDIIPIDDESPAEGCDRDFEKEVSIKSPTNSSEYMVHVFYGPEDPVRGCEMQWLIKFISTKDDTEFLREVQFDLLVMDDDDGLLPLRSIAQEDYREYLYSPTGQYVIDMIVKEDPGNARYVIWVYGTSPEGTVPSTGSDHLEVVVPILAGK